MVHLSEGGAELWRGGAFSEPTSVSVNSTDGSCWVADCGHNQVVHLSESGAELWRSAGGAFSQPECVSVNATEDSCWVADYGHGQVAKLVVSAVTPPVAGFSGTPTSGVTALPVQFTDLSTNYPTSWSWTFGEGGTSAVQNPGHTYGAAGSYTVALTATNALGSNTCTKSNYITVVAGADFNGTPTSGAPPLNVSFTDASTNSPTSWAWDFGDGGVSTAQNPSHTYSAPGAHDVALSVNGPLGSNRRVKPGYIIVDFNLNRAQLAYLCACVLAGGETNVPPGPTTPTFPDVPTDFWAYKYVEYCKVCGIMSGYSDGTFQPMFQITRDQMAVYASRVISAYLGEDVNYYVPPATPTFADVPPSQWAYKYIEYLNLHVTNAAYSSDGTFAPSLAMSAFLAASWLEQGTDTLVTPYAGPYVPPAPVAAFSGAPTSGLAPLNVNFTDASTNVPTSWSWTFGDSRASTVQSPSHTYNNAGAYTVALTATNASGSNTCTKGNYITTTAPAPVADFGGTPTSGTAPLTVNFTDATTNGPTSWSWDFGDGNTATVQSPSHTYTTPGTYTVALTATNAWDSDTATKVGYIGVRPVAAETVVETWKSASGAFSMPYWVSANSTDGSCWVADWGTYDPGSGSYLDGAVTQLSSAGAQLWQSGSGKYNDPVSVSVNTTDGSCWVAALGLYDPDTGMFSGAAVAHLSSAGQELWQSASDAFGEPTSVSVNAADNSCWVADWDTGQVTHLSSTGGQLWQSASGAYPDLWSVSVNRADGSCWVADWNEVVHLSSAGAELLRAPADEFNVAADISVNSADNSCWVADAGSGQVVHLSSAGTELWRSATGEFICPWSVSVNAADGSCWITEAGIEDYNTGASSESAVVHVSSTGTELWRSASGEFLGQYEVSVNRTDGSCWAGGGDVTGRWVVHLTTVIPPNAAFSGTPKTGQAPLAVSFTDQSTHAPTSWSWTFGEGGTSTAQNPSHTYNDAGTYTVALTAANAGGSNTCTKSNYITATQPPPVADFSGTPTTGVAPLTVAFTDASSHVPTSWSWTFGDGGVSTAQNPSHTYTTAGTCSVALTAKNAAGSNTCTKSKYITVLPPPPVANFTASTTTGKVPLSVTFTDTSTNTPTTWSWTFGDGGTSTARNPSHTYTAGGSFTVALTAANAGGPIPAPGAATSRSPLSRTCPRATGPGRRSGLCEGRNRAGLLEWHLWADGGRDPGTDGGVHLPGPGRRGQQCPRPSRDGALLGCPDRLLGLQVRLLRLRQQHRAGLFRRHLCPGGERDPRSDGGVYRAVRGDAAGRGRLG